MEEDNKDLEEDFDLEEVNEVEEQKIEKYSIENDPEIQKIRDYAKQIEEAVKNNPKLINRVENKHDFASEVINTKSNQKVANLNNQEIFNLLDKRTFMNFLSAYGWRELANLVALTITDIENYSLSKNGFLIERTMVDNIRQSSVQSSITSNKQMKGGANV